MKIRSIALAAVAVASFGAQAAALTTYQPWETAYTGNGLSGVLFNITNVSGGAGDGAVLAMGAHAYKNGVSLSNNGTDTFNANAGTFAEPGKAYANWSFDFGYSLGNCTTCTVWLGIDRDTSAGVNLFSVDITSHSPNPESWNMEMGFIDTLWGTNFNPNAASSTAFSLQLRDAAGTTVLGQSDITVNVPEPGSLALVGLALAGLAAMRRRKV